MSLVQQKTYVSPRTTTSASCTGWNGGARRTSLSMSSSAVTGKLSHGEFTFRVLVSHMENNGVCVWLSLVYSTIYLHLALRLCETKTQSQSLIVSVSQLLLLTPHSLDSICVFCQPFFHLTQFSFTRQVQYQVKWSYQTTGSGKHQLNTLLFLSIKPMIVCLSVLFIVCSVCVWGNQHRKDYDPYYNFNDQSSFQL